MARYDFASLRQAADEIEQVAMNPNRYVGAGEGHSIKPEEIADEPAPEAADDLSGQFLFAYGNVLAVGMAAYVAVDRELLVTAAGLRAMAKVAEDADSKSTDDIFHRFAKYADTGGGTNLAV